MGVASTQLTVAPEITQEARELTRLANDLFRGIGELTIQTQDEFEIAGDWSKKIARLRKDTEAAKKARRDPLNSLLNAISAEYEAPLAVLKTAETSLDTGLKKYIAAERARQEELNRQRERERQAAVLAAAKAAEEARQAEIDARRAADLAVAAPTPEAQYAASDAAVAADDARAAAVEAYAPVEELAVPVESYVPVKGIHTRETWFARVVNEALVPREHMIPDNAKLDRLAKAIKGPSNIPGVEFYAETSLVKKTR